MAARKHLFLLILLALISLKVASAAIHVYTHHIGDNAHIEDCELCDHAINNQELEFDTPTPGNQPEATPLFIATKQEIFYQSGYTPSSIYNDQFCRPPPRLT